MYTKCILLITLSQQDLSMVLSTEKDVYVYGSTEVFTIRTIHGPEPCQGQLLVTGTCLSD